MQKHVESNYRTKYQGHAITIPSILVWANWQLPGSSLRLLWLLGSRALLSRHSTNMIIGRIAARRAPSAAVRRMSTAEPKMHKAKEWQVIKDSRPKTHDHVSCLVGVPLTVHRNANVPPSTYTTDGNLKDIDLSGRDTGYIIAGH